MNFTETLNALFRHARKVGNPNIPPPKVCGDFLGEDRTGIEFFVQGKKALRKILLTFSSEGNLYDVEESVGNKCVRTTDHCWSEPSRKAIHTIKYAEDGTGARKFIEIDTSQTPKVFHIAQDRYNYNFGQERAITPTTKRVMVGGKEAPNITPVFRIFNGIS